MRTAANLWAVGSTCENMCKTLWSQSEGDQHAYNEKKKKKDQAWLLLRQFLPIYWEFSFPNVRT